MICLLAATPHETKLLRQQLPLAPDLLLPGQTFSGQFCNEKILLLHTGIGISSAASSLTRLLEHVAPSLLIAFGCGGSYPASGLVNGDLALATSEYFGDLGVASKQGFIPLSELGLKQPTVGPPLFSQQFELVAAWQQAAGQLLSQAKELADIQIASGPFVTVNTVSGTVELCSQLEQLEPGICENMEGAALAQAAASYDIPLLELRGISNPCGSREPTDWDLPAGMNVAQKAVLRLLKEMPRMRSLACA